VDLYCFGPYVGHVNSLACAFLDGCLLGCTFGSKLCMWWCVALSVLLRIDTKCLRYLAVPIWLDYLSFVLFLSWVCLVFVRPAMIYYDLVEVTRLATSWKYCLSPSPSGRPFYFRMCWQNGFCMVYKTIPVLETR